MSTFNKHDSNAKCMNTHNLIDFCANLTNYQLMISQLMKHLRMF